MVMIFKVVSPFWSKLVVPMVPLKFCVFATSAVTWSRVGMLPPASSIGRAIDEAGGNMPTRDQVTAEVAKTQNFKGTIGTTSFDQNGDTTLKIITIYKWTSATDTGGTFVDQITVS